MKGTITKTLDVELTPEDLASLFWSLDSDQQAVFFSTLAQMAGSFNLEMQMFWVAPSDRCGYYARDALSAMGYSHRRAESYDAGRWF